MRKERIIEIDGKEIIVRELKTKDVCELYESDSGIKILVGLVSGMPGDIQRLMRYSIDVSDEEFARLTENINTYTKIEQEFMEVNNDFFASLPAKIDSLLRFGQVAMKKMGPSLKQRASSLRKDT
jgi:hypothetical protein